MIGRARLVLLLSLVAAVLIVGMELPLGQMAAERSASSKYGAQLAKLRAEDRALAAQIAALGTSAQISTLAHADYGLVYPGQRAYVILPSANIPSAGRNPLAPSVLSGTQVVPSDAGNGPAIVGTAAGAGASGTIAGQVVHRLEFWRWAF